MAITEVKAFLQALKDDKILTSYESKGLTPDGQVEEEDGTITYTYVGQIAAPDASSYRLDNNRFNVVVTASTAADTDTVDKNTPPEEGTCELRVLEKQAPVITLDKQITTTNDKNIIVEFTFQDLPSGTFVNNTSNIPIASGVGEVKATFSKNGVEYNFIEEELIYTDGVITGAKYHSIEAVEVPGDVEETTITRIGFTDGTYVVQLTITDNDGNSTTSEDIEFIVDTIGPTLEVSEPVPGVVITNNITVKGKTEPGVTVNIFVDGVQQDSNNVEIDDEGNFNFSFYLADNTEPYIITVKATDSAGNTSSLDVKITVDTTTPVITSVTFEPDEAEAGKEFKLIVKVRLKKAEVVE